MKTLAKRAAGNVLQKVISYEEYVTVVRTYGKLATWLEDRSVMGPVGYIKNRRKLRDLRGRFAGRRCFVIGNGPSLRVEDVRRLQSEITIGCNGLFLMFDDMGFKPTFYTVEDQLVAEDRAPEIRSFHGPTKIFPWDRARYLPPDNDTLYVNFPREYAGFPRFSEDLEQQAFFGGTVTYLNLQIAYHIGCRDIYLIGIDHNYQVPQEKVDERYVITSDAPDVNHFDSRYFGPGYRWHDPQLDRMEAAYHAAKAFTDAHGARIWNATRGGKLEVFPRVNFDELF